MDKFFFFFFFFFFWDWGVLLPQYESIQVKETWFLIKLIKEKKSIEQRVLTTFFFYK